MVLKRYIFIGVVLLVTIITIIILSVSLRNKIRDINQMERYYELLELADSIRNRQNIRALEEKHYNYVDSLRTIHINELKNKSNEKNKKFRDVISRIPNSGYRYKDSLWIDEFDKPEGNSYGASN